MEFKKTVDGIDYHIYYPSIIKHYEKCYNEEEQPNYWGRFSHFLTMLYKYLFSGYFVVYMKIENVTLGHLVVSKGNKIFDGTKKDIEIGPVWISPRFRNHGFGTAGIKAVLHSLDIDYENAYEKISAINFPSIKTALNNSFVLVKDAKYINGKASTKDRWQIYKYTKNK